MSQVIDLEVIDETEESLIINTSDSDEPKVSDDGIFSGVRKIRTANIWAVRIFFVLFFAVAVFSFWLPLRPAYSETERRELEKFPKFKYSSLVSGDYFDSVGKWYSDTFPAREALISVNTAFEDLFGFGKFKIEGEVETGDDIPALPPAAPSMEEPIVEPPESTAASEAQAGESNPPLQPEAPQEQAIPEVPLTQNLGALLRYGDTAYEYYNFSQSAADTYIAALNNAAALLEGRANIYDILVPTSIAITLPDEVAATLNISDQKTAIDYLYSSMRPDISKVRIFNRLRNHKKEYIYFRTDHHWTALGAYYAYTKFAEVKGITPTPLTDYTEYQFPGYLGSFYNQSNKSPALGNNPDTVYAYCPRQTNSMSLLSKYGLWGDYNIISDMSQSTAGSKYITFIRGDHPLSYIQNPELTDSSCCIVIKESFGNAFVPFLVPNYQTVYIVDYRYIAGVDARGLSELQAQTGAQDIIFINNMSATRNKSLMDSIYSYVR